MTNRHLIVDIVIYDVAWSIAYVLSRQRHFEVSDAFVLWRDLDAAHLMC